MREIRNKEEINKIVYITCEHFNLTPYDVFKKSNLYENKTARQIIHYFLKTYSKLNLREIGLLSLDYGRPKKHDHASVIHSVKVVKDLINTEKEYLKDIEQIEEMYIKSVSTEQEFNDLMLKEKEDTKTIEETQIKYLQEIILKREEEIENLKEKLIQSNQNLHKQHSNKYITRLISSGQDVINEVCETRLMPYFRMLDKRVTEKDLIDFQYKTRDQSFSKSRYL
jgi:hypothetical protein